MVEFETLKAEEIRFGNNNFIEVARKRAISEEGQNEFVAISRGFFAPDGSKRFKKSFTIPDIKEVVNFICTKIKEMSEGSADVATDVEQAEQTSETESEASEMSSEVQETETEQ